MQTVRVVCGQWIEARGGPVRGELRGEQTQTKIQITRQQLTYLVASLTALSRGYIECVTHAFVPVAPSLLWQITLQLSKVSYNRWALWYLSCVGTTSGRKNYYLFHCICKMLPRCKFGSILFLLFSMQPLHHFQLPRVVGRKLEWDWETEHLDWKSLISIGRSRGKLIHPIRPFSAFEWRRRKKNKMFY